MDALPPDDFDPYAIARNRPVKDGSNLVLAGDFVTTPDDTITLACAGSTWYEVARSAN